MYGVLSTFCTERYISGRDANSPISNGRIHRLNRERIEYEEHDGGRLDLVAVGTFDIEERGV